MWNLIIPYRRAREVTLRVRKCILVTPVQTWANLGLFEARLDQRRSSLAGKWHPWWMCALLNSAPGSWGEAHKNNSQLWPCSADSYGLSYTTEAWWIVKSQIHLRDSGPDKLYNLHMKYLNDHRMVIGARRGGSCIVGSEFCGAGFWQNITWMGRKKGKKKRGCWLNQTLWLL